MSETEAKTDPPANEPKLDFIRERIQADLASGKHASLQTRFPPEPNGYLHIGHAKAICLNFGVAEEFDGKCNLRFDDTNPAKEDTEYVDAIKADVAWLGFSWGEEEFFASNYFEQLYELAVQLIRDGKAYVDSLSAEEIREHRGTLTSPGKNSPYRDRSPEENLELFQKMRAGEFPDGAHVLRAKIDMTSPNMNLRDPALYRIRKEHHHRTGDDWCIYPMYDYAHGLSDWIEGVTHSLCSLEFENHRPLYDWILVELGLENRPQQIEFARLNLTYTMMSKRNLLKLVTTGAVSGWDDPRMPTLAGLRRRGFTPTAIRAFTKKIGIAKVNSTVDVQLLEACLREDLNKTSARAMVVQRPLKLVIENYPEGEREAFEAVNNPEDPEAGSHPVPFGRELWIDRDDFMEEAPKKYYRLSPGREVRLRYACLVTCTGFTKNDAGVVTEVRCTWDPESRGGASPDGRRVKGTIHWVSAADALDAEVRLYDRLFTTEDANAGGEWEKNLNPNSLEVLTGAKVEPHLASVAPGDRLQFERLGYYCVDLDSKPGALVFNRTVTLRDSWKKAVAKASGKGGPATKPGKGQKKGKPGMGKKKLERERRRKREAEQAAAEAAKQAGTDDDA